MQKRFLSLFLALALLISCVPTVYAEDVDYTWGTQVEWTANQTSAYTLTVPAKLEPSQSGPVTLSGSWPSNVLVNVTADKIVRLTNSLNRNEDTLLDVTFPGIAELGDNTQPQTFTQNVSVEDVQGLLFGVWSGTFNYNVTTQEVATNPSANMRLAISNPASKQSNNPTISPTAEYVIKGFASAENGIKSLTIECIAEKELIVTQCNSQAMGMHQLQLDNFLSEDEAASLTGQSAIYTNMNGETLEIVLFDVGQNTVRLTDAYYSKMGPMKDEIAQKGKCSIFVTNTISTTTLNNTDIQNGEWNATVTLPANSTTTVKATLEDELENAIELSAYVTYSEDVPFEYGAYRAGAIEEFIKYGEDADIQNLFLESWDDVTYRVDSMGYLKIEDSYYYSGWGSVDLIIPESYGATKIGKYSFDDICTIGGLYLPEGITLIEQNAFEYLSGCRIIYIPASVTTISEDLADIRALGSFVVNEQNPNYCSVDGSLYTKDMKTLIRQAQATTGTITLPDGLTKISNCAFYTSRASKVIIPDSLTTIGYDAFQDAAIKEVVLSKNLTSMGSYAFCDTAIVDIEIPASLKEISHCTFQGCDNLKTITLHKGLESIDVAAFYGCSSLETIYFYGTEEDWNAISITSDYNDALLTANIVYLTE